MADDAEKTEEATPKKIEDARKEGNVPKSQDASGVITLFVALLALLMLFPFISKHFQYTIHNQSLPFLILTPQNRKVIKLYRSCIRQRTIFKYSKFSYSH